MPRALFVCVESYVFYCRLSFHLHCSLFLSRFSPFCLCPSFFRSFFSLSSLSLVSLSHSLILATLTQLFTYLSLSFCRIDTVIHIRLPSVANCQLSLSTLISQHATHFLCNFLLTTIANNGVNFSTFNSHARCVWFLARDNKLCLLQ